MPFKKTVSLLVVKCGARSTFLDGNDGTGYRTCLPDST